MKKIISYLIIYCLTFNISHSIELQTKKFSVPDEMLYESIPNGKPIDQFKHAENYYNIGKKAYAARAYMEFVEKNPEHELVPQAIYNYGQSIFYSYKSYPKFYNARTTPFEILIENYPEIYDQIKFKKTSLGHLAYSAHMSMLWFALTDLMYDEKKGKDFLEFRQKFCDEILSPDPRNLQGEKFLYSIVNFSERTYNSFKCTQAHGGLEKVVKAPDNSEKTQTGFRIDLLKNNLELSDLFKKYEIIFDFKNFKVSQIISHKFKYDQEINRTFEIINIDNEKIRMQQSVNEFYTFCRQFYEGFGKYVYDSNYHKHYASYKETPSNDCNITHKEFEKRLKKAKTRMFEPYLYLDFYYQTGEIAKMYFPLSKKSISLRKKGFKNPFDDFDRFKKNEKIGDIVEFLFLAATIYMVVSNIKKITKIAKGSKSGGVKVSSSTSSTGSSVGKTCRYFACKSFSQKIKILKYTGRIP